MKILHLIHAHERLCLKDENTLAETEYLNKYDDILSTGG